MTDQRSVLKKKCSGAIGSLLCFVVLLLFINQKQLSAEENGHPRIWLDQKRVEEIRKTITERDLERLQGRGGPSLPDAAFIFLMTEEEALGRKLFQKLIECDLSNPRKLAEAAVVFDWCHNHLAENQRQLVAERLAKAAIAFMSEKRAYRSFHNFMYERTTAIGLAGFAISGEHHDAPRLLRFAQTEYADAHEMLETLFSDGSWPEGITYNRHVLLPACQYFLALRSVTGEDVFADSKYFRNAPLYTMYSTYPDGTTFNGSDNDFPFLKSDDKLALQILAHEYRDGHAVTFVRSLEQARGINDRYAFSPYLWPLENIKPKPLEKLPRARLFKGTGLLLARSGWGPRDTYLSFRSGDFFGDHCHYDVNSFTIYKKGPLAIDSGLYDDDWDFRDFRKSHLFNYYRRTIAHNTILVHDPEEKFLAYEGHPLANDGGQREILWSPEGAGDAPADYRQEDPAFGKHRTWLLNPGKWETGEILTFHQNQYYCYVAADGTKAYSDHKVTSYIRHLLFIYPDILLVYDQMESKQPAFKKTWLLHSEREPLIKEKTVRITNGRTQLHLLSLLPAANAITKVGGKGKQHMVGARNFPTKREVANRGETPGQWRVEISPSRQSRQDEFLNLIFLDPLNEKLPTVATKFTRGKNKVKFSSSGYRYVITFFKDKRLAFDILIEDEQTGKILDLGR